MKFQSVGIINISSEVYKVKIINKKASGFKLYKPDIAGWLASWWESDGIYWANGWFLLDKPLVSAINESPNNPIDDFSIWLVEAENEDITNIEYFFLDRGMHLHINAKKYRKKKGN